MFDLDGVLRNTEPYHRMAYAQLARSLSGGAPPDAGEIAGKSNLQLYEALVARFGGPATAERTPLPLSSTASTAPGGAGRKTRAAA